MPRLVLIRRHRAFRDVQIRPARQHRQGLVRRVAAHVRAQIERVPRGGEELQICPVRVVHEERQAARVAYLRERRCVLHAAEVVRGSYVNRKRPLSLVQCPRERLGRDGAGAEGGGCVGVEPHGLEPEQGAAVQEALVCVPGSEDAVPRALGAEDVSEVEHRLDAL